jgi:hypothetical protein
VEAYSAKVVEHHKESEQEVKQIIALLHEATESFTDRNQKYGGEFQNFASQLEQTSKCEDLRQNSSTSVAASKQTQNVRRQLSRGERRCFETDRTGAESV